MVAHPRATLGAGAVRDLSGPRPIGVQTDAMGQPVAVQRRGWARPVAVARVQDRWLIEAQTARNLEALSAEQSGDLERAIALYERNVAERFPADLPYGRLVAIYERRADFEAAARVLRRAIAVFESSTRRTARDRRATIQVFRNRLAAVERRQAEANG